MPLPFLFSQYQFPPSLSSALHILSTLLPPTSAAFGPAFSTGPVAQGSFIRSSTSTLIVPAPPLNNRGDLSLWVGMSTTHGDLIQSICENIANDSSWNVYAYTLFAGDGPVQAEGSAAKEGDRVMMRYVYDDSTEKYTQLVLLNDELVSTLSTSDGYAQGWGTAVECAEEDCGTVPAHRWVDTRIVLDGEGDAGYAETVEKGEGVTGMLVSSDGGRTWMVGEIGIPEWTFGGEGRKGKKRPPG